MPSSLLLLPVVGLTLAWLSPLHLMPWPAWHGEVPVFVAVFLTALWALGRRMAGPQRSQPLPLTGMVLGLLALVPLALVQPAMGMMPWWGDAWTIVLYVGLCVAAYLVGLEAARSRADLGPILRVLAWTLLAAGVGSSLIALIQAFELYPTWQLIARTGNLRRPGGNVAQANQMATLLLMGVMGLVYLYEERKLGRVAAALLALVCCIGLATTQSKTGLLSAYALAAWWWWFRRADSRLTASGVVTVLAFATIAYFAWPPVVTGFYLLTAEEAELIAYVTPEGSRQNASGGSRLVVWGQLLEAAAQRPWFGWGLRQTSVALTSVLDAQPASDAFAYGHSLLLDMLLGFGAPLAILFTAALALWGWRRRDVPRDLAGWFLLGVCLPFGIHMMLEFPHAYAYLLAPVLFAIGIVDARRAQAARIRVPAGLAAGAAVLVAALGATSLIEYVDLEEDFRVARFEARNLGSVPDGYERPDIKVLTQVAAFVNAARMKPQRGMPEQRLREARDAAYRFPSPALQHRYALALVLNGDEEGGMRMLRVIRAMHGPYIYEEIRKQWQDLAWTTYPELLVVALP
jgi:O-antigen ligase